MSTRIPGMKRYETRREKQARKRAQRSGAGPSTRGRIAGAFVRFYRSSSPRQRGKMVVLLLVILSLPFLYVALQWNELIHNVSPISSKVGSCGTIAERPGSLESRFVSAPCVPGDGAVVFYLDSVGKSTTCDGDLFSMTGRSESRFYRAGRTACLAPLLAQGSCYELLGPESNQSLAITRGACGVSSYTRVDRVLSGTTDRSRCPAANFTLSYSRPTPTVYCIVDLDGSSPRPGRRTAPTTIPA